MRRPLFAFGTLRDPEVLAVVLGREPGPGSFEPTWLPGHRVARLPDETCPVLVAADRAAVRGDLVHELGEVDWARIRFWESDEYELRPCRVRRGAPAGEEIEALICADGDAMPGAVEPWALAEWQAVHKAGFLDDARRCMSLFGRMSLAEADREWIRMRSTGTGA